MEQLGNDKRFKCVRYFLALGQSIEKKTNGWFGSSKYDWILIIYGYLSV